MKTIITMTLFLGLMACQESTTDNSYSASSNKISESEVKVANLSEETAQQILKGYLKIKDALVDTDAEAAAYAAGSLLFDFEENENKFIEKLFHEVKLIEQSKDVDQQRIYFQGLSNNMHTFVKNIDHTGMAIYQQYCPMAFDNTGAYWISDNKKVYNPYFGDKMLRCGKVTEVIE